MQEKLNFLLWILQSKYKNWEKLEEIFKQLKESFWAVYSISIFQEFCLKNKKSKAFNEEFQKSCFIENITDL